MKTFLLLAAAVLFFVGICKIVLFIIKNRK